MSEQFLSEIYVPHEGTLRVSGITNPRKCGRCAHFYLNQGVKIIDFFCIGANANQQAMKSMGIFMVLVKKEMESKGISVAFQPLRFRTETVNQSTQEMEFKDSTVWRTVIVKV